MIYLISLLGLCLGGLADRCCDRWPKHEAVLSPPAACQACGQRLGLLASLPVLGYLATGGACSKCGVRRPLRHLLVELVTAGLCVAAWLAVGLTWRLPLALLLVVAAAIATVCDLEQRIVPNALTLPGTAAALLLALPAGRFLDSLYGLAVCGGAFLIIGLVGGGKLGGGDVKLAALIGAALGFSAGLQALFIGVIAGGAYSLYLVMTRLGTMRSAIPFAPFLAGAAVATLLYGDSLLQLAQQTLR